MLVIYVSTGSADAWWTVPGQAASCCYGTVLRQLHLRGSCICNCLVLPPPQKQELASPGISKTLSVKLFGHADDLSIVHVVQLVLGAMKAPGTDFNRDQGASRVQQAERTMQLGEHLQLVTQPQPL